MRRGLPGSSFLGSRSDGGVDAIWIVLHSPGGRSVLVPEGTRNLLNLGALNGQLENGRRG